MFLCRVQDAEGRAPIHVAISNQHAIIIQLLISHPDIRLNLRDRQGMTPFACAMTHKNNKAAEAILKREAGAAEQVCVCAQPSMFGYSERAFKGYLHKVAIRMATMS